MPRPVYHNANKFHRVDRLTPASVKPRRLEAQNYYQASRHKRRAQVVRIIFIIAALILIQSIFQIPWLRLNNLEINGLTRAPKDQIITDINNVLDQRRLFIFKNNNYFLFKPGSLVTDLSAKYYLDGLTLKKSFPHTLVLNASERISPFVRQTPEAYYILTYNGQSLERTTQLPENTTIIADERQNISDNIPLSYLEQATKLLGAWKIDARLAQIEKFHLNDEPEQIIISTIQGFRIIFSQKEEFSTQLENLNQIFRQNILPNTIQYIDLRFGNNVYFK